MDKKSNSIIWIIVGVIILAILAYFFFQPSPAAAQEANSGSVAGSVAQIDSTQISGAAAQSNVTMTSPESVATRATGDTTLRTVGQATAPSFGSGHPCSLGASASVSIIGLGLAGGQATVDDACLLAQMGHTVAATAMIAARSPAACRALRLAGDIAASSNCGDTTTEQRVSTSNLPTVQCIRDAAGNTVRIEVAPGVDPAAARAYCQ
jgi:hypothetical protein